MKPNPLVRGLLLVLGAGLIGAWPAPPALAQAFPSAMSRLLRLGAAESQARRVHESIHQATGFGNTFLVSTPDGAVVIDTSMAFFAPRHHKLLKAADSRPVRYIVLTHGHEDHTGGVELWREEGTKVVAQRNFVEVLGYQDMLAGFFGWRNAAQFALPLASVRGYARRQGERNPPDILYDERHQFTVGGVTFEVHATPGETSDHSSVWVPEYKAAFVGDNFYPSFPNIYTLRGCRPRWPRDYITSLDKVRSWGPEILLPSHGDAIVGAEEVERSLKRYRDAIAYVHDETVRGMNEGKDVFTLMKEIRLPSELDVGEEYGTVAWSVRGIYEGYVGWFDGNPANMYAVAPREVNAELVELAGGPEKVVARAREVFAAGKVHEAIHLADVARAGAPDHPGAWKVRLEALQALRGRASNVIEQGWLDHGIREAEAKLKGSKSP